MERLLNIPGNYWGQFAYPDNASLGCAPPPATPDQKGKTLAGMKMRNQNEEKKAGVKSENVLICSEHPGTSDHPGAPDDGEDALLQLTVSADDADSLQHHHVKPPHALTLPLTVCL